MAIRFVSGKPGAGKSYYATTLVLERLRNSKKQIVTNLPLDVGRICEYLHAEFGETFNAAERIRLLSEGQAANFWLYFGNGLELDRKQRIHFIAEDGRRSEHLNYEPRYEFAKVHPDDNSGAVCYFIDEAHEFFNAREWKDLGKDCLHYLSQHRKLGDDVTFITQHVRNVDTQLRRLCFEFIYCRNHLKEKLPGLGGLFRSIPRFGVASYNQEESPSAIQVDHKYVKPDWKGIGTCYDTAAGVGIGGAQADKGERAKGLPLSFVFVLLAIAGLGFHFLTDGRLWAKLLSKEPEVLQAAVLPVAKTQTAASPGAGAPGTRPSENTNDLRVTQNSRPVAKTQESENKLEALRVTGLNIDPRKGISVFLSDGREVRGHQKAFGGIKYFNGWPESVVIDGQELPL